MKIVLVLLLLFISSSEGCSQEQDSLSMQKKPIEQVMKDHQDTLLALPGVQGFYQSAAADGSDIIVIMVDTLTEEKKKVLPDSLDGYPVKHEETGIIRPLK